MKTAIAILVIFSPFFAHAAPQQTAGSGQSARIVAQPNQGGKKVMKHGKKIKRFKGNLAPKKN